MDDLKNIIENIESAILENDAVAIYFSTKHCNVCKVLKPKVIELIEKDFPKMTFQYIDIEEHREVAAKYSVFAVPTVIFFFGGKEAFRKSRNFGISELSDAIERPYSMIFA